MPLRHTPPLDENMAEPRSTRSSRKAQIRIQDQLLQTEANGLSSSPSTGSKSQLISSAEDHRGEINMEEILRSVPNEDGSGFTESLQTIPPQVRNLLQVPNTGAVPKKPTPTVCGLPPPPSRTSAKLPPSSTSGKMEGEATYPEEAFGYHLPSNTISSPDLVKLVSEIVQMSLRHQQIVIEPPKVETVNLTANSRNNNAMVNCNNLENLKFIPIFDDNGSIHPVDFIRQVEQLIDSTNFPLAACFLADKFKGRAKTWADVFLSTFNEFDSFKTAFLEQFWGHSQQLKVKLLLESNVYNEGSFVDYFLHFVGMGKHLQPSYEERMLISTISRHFPPHIASCLVGVRTVRDALDRLRHADQFYGVRSTRQSDQARFSSNPQIHNHGIGNRPYMNRNDFPRSRQTPSKNISAVIATEVSESPEVNNDEYLSENSKTLTM